MPSDIHVHNSSDTDEQRSKKSDPFIQNLLF